MIRATVMALCILTAVRASAATDLWELPPTRYSEATAQDPVAMLKAKLGQDPDLLGSSPLDRLRSVLKHLDIPEASQILVFSKTSKQNELIHPGNPRSIFFSENAYAGYVPGGDIEVISHDPVLGLVYYLIRNPRGPEGVRITRETSSCLSCHGTARTEDVPGVLVRSVFADETGQPLLARGTHLTTHSSPIPDRWGGYYVTGTSSLPHMGNQTFPQHVDDGPPRATPQHPHLENIIDTRRYLRPTSDIVALMVLEHQCQMQNLLAAARINHRRYLWLRRSLHPEAGPDDPEIRDHMRHSATKIVNALLFDDEAPLGPGGISGDPAFQDAFTRRFPRSPAGRSLADFQLHKRLFKHPCSYMIYSAAFMALPAPLRQEVLSQLKSTLAAAPETSQHPQIPASTRRKILSILAATVPNWPQE